MSFLLSRRRLIQGGVAALAAGSLPPAAAAQSPLVTFPTLPPPQSVPPPRGLAAVGSALRGVGVYIGNEWFDWDDDARRFALARVRAWGFDFISPKVGGYGRTWYRDEAHLRGWAESARGVGLGFVPFLYTIPETGEADARIAAQMARVIGIVCVDMEDEWGAKERGAPAGYKGAQMAAFGQVYRQEAGALPIIVTGYGDPITRFGPASTGFPQAEMAAWADAYSPQWYIGVYSRYHTGGVAPALAWGQDECRQALGADFPLCPSVSLECSYSPDRLLPLPDTRLLMQSVSAADAPVFVWEYGLMTPAHAEALLGPPVIRSVRVGLTKSASLQVLWDTHVPARAQMVCAPAGGAAQTSADDTLALTHSGGASALAPGTACRITVQSSSGGGDSAAVPLTVVTAPATPGVFVLSALAARGPLGHVTVTLLAANSADTDVPDVQVTSVSADAGTLLSPAPLPVSLGALGKRDWEATGRDRAALSVVVSALPTTTKELTLTVAGTASGDPWTATVPVGLPA